MAPARARVLSGVIVVSLFGRVSISAGVGIAVPPRRASADALVIFFVKVVNACVKRKLILIVKA